jgi:predicted transglutaminase-like cysteine proteinase
LGLAKITSGGPAGKYNIELVRDIARITAAITAIDARLAVLDQGIAEALAGKIAAEAALSAKLGELNAAITDYNLKIITLDALQRVQGEYLAALSASQAKTTAYSLLIQEKESKTQAKKALEKAALPDYRTGVWCADLTQNLPAGEEVGIIEVNGESQIAPIIFPGGDYDNLPSSKLQPALASTAAGVFYNAAIYPAWQRWLPTYRIGTITAISGNVCNLTLDSARSTAQNLNINPLTIDDAPYALTGVPIEYMDGLNGEVFLAGDRVVVEFTNRDWTQPKVIGFESNPRDAHSTAPNYYVFYRAGGITKIADCSYGQNSLVVNQTKNYDKLYMTNTTQPLTFHCKRFRHNVMENGVTVARNLYFIATSLFINPNPYTGWVNFAAANPTFALVTNRANSQIPVTPQLLADMADVNLTVNHAYPHTQETGGDDVWKFPDSGGMDCEDAALEKAKRLLALGYPASALHIECGNLEYTGQGHAWLVVQTTGGDYALDMNYDAPQANAELKELGQNLILRQRQIGMKWAAISPYSWMCSSDNVGPPLTFWYILDPQLNIMHMISATPMYYPFAYVRDSADPAHGLSGPSINFSADNNRIYVAANGTITGYKLNNNSLDVMSTSTYTSRGYVGRNGTIVEPVDTFGNQDPWSCSMVDEGGGVDNITVVEFGGKWHLSSIGDNLLGMFKCLDDAEVMSAEGYYEYKYTYLTGQFSAVRVGLNETLIFQWSDLDNPDVSDVYVQTNIQYDAEDNPVYYETQDVIDFNRQIMNSLIGKSFGAATMLYATNNRLDKLLHPESDPFDATDWDAKIVIPYGPENIAFYDEHYVEYGGYYPHMWTHIEADTARFIQGLLLIRPTDAGDNQKRLYRNGASILSAVAATVGVPDTDLLGMAFVPGTDRL